MRPLSPVFFTLSLRNPRFHCHSPWTQHCTRLLGFLFSPWISIHSANLPQPFNPISINFRFQPFRSAIVARLLAHPTRGYCHFLLVNFRVEFSTNFGNQCFFLLGFHVPGIPGPSDNSTFGTCLNDGYSCIFAFDVCELVACFHSIIATSNWKGKIE